LNYSTNNLFGLGETLDVQASVGNQQRNISLGFTEPYLFDKPLAGGFPRVQQPLQLQPSEELSLQTGQRLNLTPEQLQNILNYTQSSTGFQLSLSYPLHRSFKRLGISYLFDRSSTQTSITVPHCCLRISRFEISLAPTRSTESSPARSHRVSVFSTLDSYTSPHHGKSVSIAAEISGWAGMCDLCGHSSPINSSFQ